MVSNAASQYHRDALWEETRQLEKIHRESKQTLHRKVPKPMFDCSLWVSSGCSGFCLQSKSIHYELIGDCIFGRNELIERETQ